MSAESPDQTGWVQREVGARLERGTGARDVEVGLALRRNPRRAQLLVSPALAKHVPVGPECVRRAARLLARRIEAAVPMTQSSVCVGFAETATGLALAVAEELGEIDAIHSTRIDDVEDVDAWHFSEPHSHAPEHLLVPTDPSFLRDRDLVVLVDDELTTGRTAANLVALLRPQNPRATFVVASLLDAREQAEEDLSGTLWVALDQVRVTVPDGAVAVASDWADRMRQPGPRSSHRRLLEVDVRPAARPRHGISFPHGSMRAVATDIAESFLKLAVTDSQQPLHVLGMEEQIYLPVLVAEELQARVPSSDVHVSATTRSPVVTVDDPMYPIRTATQYGGAGAPRFAYNVQPESFVLVVPDIKNGSGDDAADLARCLGGDICVVRWADG